MGILINKENLETISEMGKEIDVQRKIYLIDESGENVRIQYHELLSQYRMN